MPWAEAANTITEYTGWFPDNQVGDIILKYLEK